VGQLSEPRTDCPTTLADLPEAPADLYEAQRRKPLNEHLEAQLLFYCIHNYPAEHAQGEYHMSHDVCLYLPERDGQNCVCGSCLSVFLALR
jgi:hypothetical protein